MSPQPSLRIQLFTVCLAFAHLLHAAPIPGVPTPLTVSTGLPTPTSQAPPSSSIDSTASPQQLWPSPLTLTDPNPSSSSSTSIPVATTVSTSTVVSVDTEIVTITATQTAAPVTVTQTILQTSTIIDEVTVSASSSPSLSIFEPLPTATSSSSTVASSSSSSITSSASRASITPSSTSGASWSVPTDFSNNLADALGVKRWSWGESNAKLVEGIPSSAWATAAPTSTAASPASTDATNKAATFPTVDLSNGPAMQVLFPKGSINPANKKAPTGGVGLYMSPIDLSAATNVSLEYSVFFPKDFDFVKGGKLPGLYGGHKGCSGGQESEDCFSTRLMFRNGGKGELYLYVPKGVQPEELCNTPPLSYCESKYGLSIGRGSWVFERGAWSNIRQEIRLNTPGVADGGFRIFVNDKLVLSSDAVLFRNDLAPASSSSSPATSTASSPFSALPTAPPQPTETISSEVPVPTGEASEDDGLLGGLLGGLGLGDIGDGLGNIVKRQEAVEEDEDVFYTMPTVTQTVTATPTETVFATSTVAVPYPSSFTSSSLFSPNSPSNQAGLLPQVAGALPILGGSVFAPKKSKPQSETDNAVFDGIMFNSFFGGSDPSYASPTDQYIWFNRIGLTINA